MEEGSEPIAAKPYRLSATLLTRDRDKALAVVSELGLDRVPDVKGRIRLLLWPDEVPLLLERGCELQLHRVLPVAPLEPRLIRTDAEVKDELTKRLRGVRRKRGA